MFIMFAKSVTYLHAQWLVLKYRLAFLNDFWLFWDEWSDVQTTSWTPWCYTIQMSLLLLLLPHAVNCVRFCFWCCMSLFVRVWNISEPLNWFAPNSQGRHVWSLARTSLNVKSKFKVTTDKNWVFGWYLGNRWTDLQQIHTEDMFGPSLGRVWRSRSISAACVRFVFGKTSLR